MRSPLLVVAAVLLIGLAWFGRSAFGGYFVSDESFMMDTYHVSTFLDVYAGYVGRGSVPLWLPEFSGGMPALGSWMYGFLYPGVLLWVALPADMAWTWSALLHMALGAGGMYFFLLERRGCVAAAATAAFLFAVSEYFVGRAIVGHLNLVWPVAWVPWVLWQVSRCARGAPGAGGWLALVAGLGLLSGHVQVWFWMAPVVASFCLLEARERGWAALRPMLLGGGLGVLLAAVQILPTYRLVSVSAPVGMPTGLLEEWSAPGHLLASKIAPGMLGWGRAARWGARLFDHETLGIGGLGALLLVVLGVRLRRERVFWLVVAIAGGVLAAGKFTPVTDALMRLPLLSWSRVPARALVLTLLAGSVLAGHGVADWLAAGPAARLRRSALWTGGLALAALLLFLRWSFTRDWPLPMLGGVMRSHAEVWRLVAGRALALSALGGGLVAAALLHVRERPGRAPLVPLAALAAALLSGVPPVATVHSDFYDLPWSSMLTADVADHRVRLVQVRQPYVEPDGIRSMRRFSHVNSAWFLAVEDVEDPDIDWWMDLVPWVTTGSLVQARPAEIRPRPDTPSPFRLVPAGTPPVGRARLFPAARKGVPDSEALARMAAGERNLLLASGSAVGPAGGGEPLPGGVAVRTGAGPEEIVLGVDAPAECWLFVSEKFFPGWEARVDGADVPLERASVAFMAVRVPAGRHRVVLRYRSAPAAVGALLTLLALLGAGAWILVARRRTRVPGSS